MIPVNSQFDLFFSGGPFDSSDYSMGYAVCSSPTGPCHQPSPEPFLTSHAGQSGPGGGEVFLGTGGKADIVYAAWTNGKVGYSSGGVRSLFAAQMDLAGVQPALSSQK